MKSLRRSLVRQDQHSGNGNARISTPLSLPAVSKPSSAILPPTKVIKALDNYRAQAPQELGFVKGDFFHVIREVDRGTQAWYEAHNPVSGSRGLVPKALFEVFNKNESLRVSTVAAGPRNAMSTAPRSAGVPSSGQPPKPTFYAIVMHDFAAERPDELDARAGDAISVVAQSNREWFVAKPIGKLGRPGLIPISFVEMRDPASGQPIQDITSLLDRGEIPLVDEWKKAMNQYKAASIPLGVIDDPGYGPVPNSPFTPPSAGNSMYKQQQMAYPSPPPSVGMPDQQRPPEQSQQPSMDQADNQLPPVLPEGILVSAEVSSFHYENDDYWFRINAVFQPEDPRLADPLPALQLVLFRVYEDFYDFQITLLDTFPVEAGRAPAANNPDPTSPTRILPYMPGPVASVDAMVTNDRRGDLDEYVRNLCVLREIGAEHVLRNELIRGFFAPRAGDAEVEIDPVLSPAGLQPVEEEPFTTDMRGLSVSDTLNGGDGRYQEYEQPRSASRTGDGRAPSRTEHQRSPSRMTDNGRAPSRATDVRQRQDSQPRPPSPTSLPRMSPKPAPQRSQWDSTYSQYNDAALYGDRPESQATSSSPKMARANANAPPISATNPQPAFIKIKILDRATDDLFAIRVPPQVSHQQLMDKVRERLGDEVLALKYRNSVSGAFVSLDDEELPRWLETADKLVLYAD